MAKKDVETKVVQMRFDNQDFQKKINATIKSVNTLDDSLQFKGSKKELKELSEALDKIEKNDINKNLEKTESIVHKISVSFTELLKIKLLAKAIDTVTQSAMGLFKTITGFDNVIGGWAAYNESLTTIGGILNQVESHGKTLDDVTKAMEQLRWYADETSYSFQTMSDGIRQFVIAGVGLEDATSAVQGVANLAGSAKVFDPFKVQSAMDAIAKSMQTGYMDTMKWTTLTNTAGIVTQDFSKMLLEAAAAQGTLIRSGVGQYKTKRGGMWVTPENIRSTLSKRWLTNDVLTAVLGRYNSAAETVKSFMDAIEEGTPEAWKEVNKYFPKLGKTFNSLDDVISEVQGNPEKYSEQVVEMTKNMNANNITTRQALILMKELGHEFDEVSYKAYMSSQETTSFSQAVSYAAGSIKTSWQGIFQAIFGNVEEATSLWSDVSDKFAAVFVSPFNLLEEKFNKWSILEEGGAKDFRKTILAIIDVIGQFKDAFEEGFKSVFSGDIVTTLQTITLKLKEFSERLANDKELLDTIRNIGRFIANVFKVVSKIGGAIFKIIAKVLPALLPAFDTISEVLVDITDVIVELVSTLVDSGIIEFIGDVVVNVIKLLSSALKNLIKILKGEEVEDITGVFSEDGKKIFESLGLIAKSLTKFLGSVLQLASAGLETALKGLGGIIEWFAEKFKEGSLTLSKAVAIFIGAFLALKVFGLLRRIFDLSRIMQAISDMLWVPWELAMSVKLKAIGKMVLEIGAAVLLIAMAIEKISNINVFDLIKSLIAVGTILGVLMWFMIRISKTTKTKNAMSALRFQGIALAILMISLSVMIIFNAISKLSVSEIVKSSITLLALFAVIMLIIVGYNKLNSIALKKGIKKPTSPAGLTGTLIGISAVLLSISVAFKMISGMAIEDITKGIITIIVVFGLVALLIAVMNKTATGKKGVKLGGTILALSFALLIIASTMKLIATMTIEDINKALVVISALGLMLIATIFIIKKITNKILNKEQLLSFKKGIGAFRTIAFSLLVLSATLLILKNVEWEQIGKAFVLIGGMILIIFTTVKLFSKSEKFGKNFGKIILIMLGLTASLLILSGALMILSFVPWSSILKAFVTIIGLIAICLISLEIINKMQIKFIKIVNIIVMIGAIAVALTIISADLLILKAVGFGDIIKSFILIIGFLTIALGAMVAFGKIGFNGLAILKFAGVMALFIATLFLLSLVVSDYVNMLVKVAKIMDETGVGTVITAMLSLIAGLALLVVAMFGISHLVKRMPIGGFLLSILVMGVALGSLWGFVTIIRNIATEENVRDIFISIGVLAAISALVLAIIAVFYLIGMMFKTKTALIGIVGLGAIIGALWLLVTPLQEFAKLDAENLLKIGGIISLFLAILAGIVLVLGALGETGVSVVGVLVLLGMATAIWILAKAMESAGPHFKEFSDMFSQVTLSIVSGVETILNAIYKFISGIFELFINAIKQINNEIERLFKIFENVDSATISKIGELAGEIAKLAGGTFLKSLSDIVSTVTDLFSTIVNGKSRIALLLDILDRLVNIDVGAVSLAIQLVDKIKDLLDSDINCQPTITPVFDFSQYEAGILRMKNDFGAIASYYSANAVQNDYNNAKKQNYRNYKEDEGSFDGRQRTGESIIINNTQNFSPEAAYTYSSQRAIKNMLDDVRFITK